MSKEQHPQSAIVNSDTKQGMPVWYLPSPFYQYNEDVKALARKNGLRIIDATVTADRTNECKDPPKVTLRPEFAPAKAEGGKQSGKNS